MRAARALRRAGRAVAEAVITAGILWVAVPPLPERAEEDAGPEGTEDPASPGSPPVRHPERLRPDLPLTELERALERQLGSRTDSGIGLDMSNGWD